MLPKRLNLPVTVGKCNILGVRIRPTIFKTKWTDLKNQRKRRVQGCMYPSRRRPEYGLLPKFLIPKLLRPILPTPIPSSDVTCLVTARVERPRYLVRHGGANFYSGGGAHSVTDARVMTDH